VSRSLSGFKGSIRASMQTSLARCRAVGKSIGGAIANRRSTAEHSLISLGSPSPITSGPATSPIVQGLSRPVEARDRRAERQAVWGKQEELAGCAAVA
jgi:hypothetical protein